MMRAVAILASVVLGGGVASARDVAKRPPPRPNCKLDSKDPRCEKTININEALGIDGKLRSLSMIQFLERATEELERAALEKKSFVPKIVASVEEEAL